MFVGRCFKNNNFKKLKLKKTLKIICLTILTVVKEADVGTLMLQSLHMDNQKVLLAGKSGSVFNVGGVQMTADKVLDFDFFFIISISSYFLNYFYYIYYYESFKSLFNFVCGIF